ncbi:hypothetical protein LOZ57_004808 [Ophidiomyces ophidiicola]|uniref:uncharacterized protein n=1 Tax=Ophidiomyces ophidiicola TaxID=1387563 RepID=UPI0020C358DB|nr:uncharacterized protein LOZ57_004808 [Ophidiomyces ophidiicola]KAI1944450.1 hypothetical protein LOZ57_004808 [Ophidiomyces ophidiicola]
MEDSAELESFRRQWLAEVSARAAPATLAATEAAEPPKPAGQTSRELSPRRAAQPQPQSQAGTTQKAEAVAEEKEEPREAGGPGGLAARTQALRLTDHNENDTEEDGFAADAGVAAVPRSALEHFEAAAAHEARGQLGDSVRLYRRAYQLDAGVDQAYRQKHCPPAPPTASPPPAASATSPALSTPALIASCAGAPITPAEPLLPCPLAALPAELLGEILAHAALRDPASLARAARACRRLALVVARDQRVWRRVCQGGAFGLAGMHYAWACDVHGGDGGGGGGRLECPPPRVVRCPPPPARSWAQAFRTCPRVRFTGVYISTVNYSRPGAHAPTAAARAAAVAPVHVVTYFRYLRFYADGAVLSLLSTAAPADVVPHLTRDAVRAVKSPPHHPHPPAPASAVDPASASASAVSPNPLPPAAATALKSALRGRWRLAPPDPPGPSPSPSLSPTTSPPPHGPPTTPPHDPRDVFIETEGVDPKYTYALHLSLRSTTAAAASNTRLVWRGFWSHNRLTDDWAEFGLRNDRAFVFRRVRGWGLP